MYLSEKQSEDYGLIKHLAEQIFSEPIISITHLSGGRVSYCYEINGHLILRFPGFKSSIKNLYKVSQCAPILQKYLSYKIPLFRIQSVYVNEITTDFIIALYYEKIPGITMSNEDFLLQDKSFKKNFFTQLSDALIELHLVPVKGTLKSLPTTIENLNRCFFKSPGVVSKWAYKIFSFYSKRLKPNLSDVLNHSDLRPCNICLDDQNKLIGIIDFDSLNRGARFIVFRNYLYQKEDLKLFLRIYEQRSGYIIDPKDIRGWHKTQKIIYYLRRLIKFSQRINNFLTRKKY